MTPAPHSFDEIVRLLREMRFEEDFDAIVAIAGGGLLPAALLRERLGLAVEVLRLNFRGSDNRPLSERPRLLRQPDFIVAGGRFLLADDRVKTGATFAYARELLADAALVRTFAINGAADYSLYNEPCFPFPWSAARLI
ncbi:MAG: hypothetical protein LBR07_08040 [Puniceicoccales bacterium]|jgi:xanthine phosphoribosyltransferase|nr:hypothetical protein [Puniceicoccales bacterium]